MLLKLCCKTRRSKICRKDIDSNRRSRFQPINAIRIAAAVRSTATLFVGSPTFSPTLLLTVSKFQSRPLLRIASKLPANSRRCQQIQTNSCNVGESTSPCMASRTLTKCDFNHHLKIDRNRFLKNWQLPILAPFTLDVPRPVATYTSTFT